MIYLDFDGIQSRTLLKRRRSERGEGKLKTVLFIGVVVVLIYLGVKLVPPFVSEYQLQDKMQEQARFGIVNRYTDEQLRENVFKVVQDLEIPAKREDIKITITPSAVKITLDYTVPVDLLFYSTELHFSPSSENKSLT
ncbi:MAG: hypothetical protein ABSH39_05390 [Candidatus Acidiferrum sp.]